MIDPRRRQLSEQGVQAHRVGRGQAGRGTPARSDQTEGAERGRRVTEVAPELARETGDRSLAAGAGDRGDAARLAAEPARRDQGEPAARVGVEHQRHAERAAGKIGTGEHGGGTAGDGIGDEAAAVGAAAG